MTSTTNAAMRAASVSSSLTESLSRPPRPSSANILAAGSHTGATYYEHAGFRDAVLGRRPVGVTVADGLKAVVLGMAAQVSSAEQRVVRIIDDGWDFA